MKIEVPYVEEGDREERKKNQISIVSGDSDISRLLFPTDPSAESSWTISGRYLTSKIFYGS